MTPARLALALILAMCAVEIVQAMNTDERLLFANGLYRRGMYELAVPEYQALMTNEAAVQIRDLAAFRLGECFRNLGRTNEAAAAYSEVVLHHPDSTFVQRASFRRAEIDWQQGRLKDAATLLQKLIESKPPADIEAAALYVLGQSQLGLDRFREGEKSLRRMVREHPESPYADYARLALADVLIQQNQTTNEIHPWLDAVSEQPETPALGAEALAKAGRLAYREQNMKLAAEKFRALSERYPGDAWNERVRLDAAWAYLLTDLGEAARALADQGLAAALPADRADWLYLKANIERRIGSPNDALRLYDELLASFPDYAAVPAAAYEAAGIAFQSAEYDRALGLISRAGSVSEDRRLALWWIEAGSLRALGRQAEAADRYRQVMTHFPDSPRAPAAAYQLALIADESGDLKSAAAEFIRVAETYPQSEIAPDAWMAAAAVQIRMGQPRDAIKAWTRLITRYPDYAGLDEALISRARAEMQMENDKAAAVSLSTLLNQYTNSRFFAEASYVRGTLLEKNEEFEEAEFHYRRALSAQPAPALMRQIQHRQVAVLQRQGRHAEAADLMNRLLAAGNAQALPSPLLEWLARWNLEQKVFREADVAARLLAETGETPAWRQAGYFIAGVAARELRKHEEAVAAFTAAAAFNLNTRETPLASYQLGLIALDRNEYPVAIEHFTRAAEVASSDTAMDVRARSYLQLGIAHEAREEWAEAVRFYLGVGVLFDDAEVTPESLYRAAEVLAKQGQTVERDRMRRELKERYPDSAWTRRAEKPESGAEKDTHKESEP